tara:strand:- start:3361 stop:3969 length:609 start_codon:yes stop_codon:yes gene_type:complete
LKKYIFLLAFLSSCNATHQTDAADNESAFTEQLINYSHPSEEDVEILYFHASSVLGHLNSEQLTNVSIILEVAENLKFDKYMMLTIAFKESSFYANLTSNTGDYGLFQINARWWYKFLGYSSKKDFVEHSVDPKVSANNAVAVIRDLMRFKTCQGDDIFACYNGGPMWRKSKNRKVIESYKSSSIRIRRLVTEKYDEWISKR